MSILKVKLIIFTFIGIVGFGFVIAIPTSVLSVNFSTYGSITASPSFEYLPGTPSDAESLYLNIDYGNIKIDYINPPVDYFVKIDVNIEMGGEGMVGKDYSDYFEIIEGDTTGSPINFTMRFLPGITESEVEPLIKEVSIVVSIQKGILFDIFATVLKGNVIVTVPFMAHINNIKVNTSFGKISYILRDCFVEGNITAFSNRGDIILKSRNAKFVHISFWYLKSIQNSVVFDIYQATDMGANVTGYGESRDAYVTIIYEDYTYNVGAWIKLVGQTSGTPADDQYHIFNELGWTPNYASDSGYEFISNDFPAISNYNISIYSHVSRHYFRWILYNEP